MKRINEARTCTELINPAQRYVGWHIAANRIGLMIYIDSYTQAMWNRIIDYCLYPTNDEVSIEVEVIPPQGISATPSRKLGCKTFIIENSQKEVFSHLVHETDVDVKTNHFF